MHPTYSAFSDLYSRQHHHQTSQYYSHFPTQNPNPYPPHQQRHLRTEPQFTSAFTYPDPVDKYSILPYSISHADGAYNAGGGLTYSHAPPTTYASEQVTKNWAAEETVHHYANSLFSVGAAIHQDVPQQLLPAIHTHSTWTNPNPVVKSHGPWRKIPKKTKIAQSAWCEICKIACTSGDVLYKHKLGKKHLKNVENLISSASVATTSNLVIAPVEKPKKGNFSGIKKKTETPQDLEIKKMKVLQGGAAANAVRTCSICNVVCNSDTVFRFHLAGQKHASMVKSLQQAGVI